jgi:hypothetical protein
MHLTPKLISKPGVAVQAYNPRYPGCVGRRIRTSRPVLRKKYWVHISNTTCYQRAGTGSSGVATSQHVWGLGLGPYHWNKERIRRHFSPQDCGHLLTSIALVTNANLWKACMANMSWSSWFADGWQCVHFNNYAKLSILKFYMSIALLNALLSVIHLKNFMKEITECIVTK